MAEGVHEPRTVMFHPHSESRPLSLSPGELGQRTVGSESVPESVPESIGPASTWPPQALGLRVHPPKTGMQSLTMVGPESFPAAQVPKPPHQPQRESLKHAEHEVIAAQADGHAPQSLGHD